MCGHTRKSALKANSEKSPCCTRESTLCQRHDGPLLYHELHPQPTHQKHNSVPRLAQLKKHSEDKRKKVIGTITLPQQNNFFRTHTYTHTHTHTHTHTKCNVCNSNIYLQQELYTGKGDQQSTQDYARAIVANNQRPEVLRSMVYQPQYSDAFSP